jgi:hypothetical protein
VTIRVPGLHRNPQRFSLRETRGYLLLNFGKPRFKNMEPPLLQVLLVLVFNLGDNFTGSGDFGLQFLFAKRQKLQNRRDLPHKVSGYGVELQSRDAVLKQRSVFKKRPFCRCSAYQHNGYFHMVVVG